VVEQFFRSFVFGRPFPWKRNPLIPSHFVPLSLSTSPANFPSGTVLPLAISQLLPPAESPGLSVSFSEDFTKRGFPTRKAFGDSLHFVPSSSSHPFH